MYMYTNICIYIYIYPPSGTYLFPVLYVFGYKFSSSRLERILHHVCASKPLPCTYAFGVCCVMVLPVFVTYVPESALFTVGQYNLRSHIP